MFQISYLAHCPERNGFYGRKEHEGHRGNLKGNQQKLEEYSQQSVLDAA